MVSISSHGNRICTLEDWFRFAPPKRGALHWRDYRSAKELARAWTKGGSPAAPPEFLFTLESIFGARLQVLEAWPEKTTPLDDLRGEPRNSDLIMKCELGQKVIVVSVEAKADEPFGDRLIGELFDEKSNTRSGIPVRISRLCRAMFGCELSEDLRQLPYQLLHAPAAAVAAAAEQHAGAAVILVHEFRSSGLSEVRQTRNQQHWRQLLQLFGMPEASRPEVAHGPFSIPGNTHIPAGIPLYLAKVITPLE